MTSKKVAKALVNLGFEYDEDVTGKDPTWGTWFGTIDPIGRKTIAGDGCCSGRAVSGNTRAEMDREAIDFAKEASPLLVTCENPDCDVHYHHRETEPQR
ncbi:hypothetical protein JQV19_08535 [Sulfitobacter mediterraneus]|uniref:hypothetical protein n=1 Tax=Sulfitobacter mediterraneus TaxID=83219 RepID=UPI00193A0B89|nr:hypothetical protein [Sulfitobacter mediterraneus]MBM1556693.1 hypothetical protein [Sulfitobacter mediterraneus]MBM1570110.1 hypothetical protein [Sulfitobacter mediterraneus]MBM1574067.1 hypothetical protein [Sulfitobacter mediterraneus]MBM1577852.1 hypothetical protein [Sulfitobacter mediterraneus]MBM1579651.1 hypothetical protein [Sulfitobacter mediterraneus]